MDKLTVECLVKSGSLSKNSIQESTNFIVGDIHELIQSYHPNLPEFEENVDPDKMHEMMIVLKDLLDTYNDQIKSLTFSEKDAEQSLMYVQIIDEICIPLLRLEDKDILIIYSKEVIEVMLLALHFINTYDSNVWETQIMKMFATSIYTLNNIVASKSSMCYGYMDIINAVLLSVSHHSIVVNLNKLYPDILNFLTAALWYTEHFSKFILTKFVPLWFSLFPNTSKGIVKNIVRAATTTEFTDFDPSSVYGRINMDEKASVKHSILIMCVSTDYLFPTQSNNLYWLNEECFHLLQDGCMSECSMTRKRAQYLLKRLTDYALVMEVTFNNDCFEWDPSTQQTSWDIMFILLETFEEVQIHVISPLLTKLDVLLENNVLSPSWYILIFERACIHESSTIIKWAVVKFLEIDWTKYTPNTKIMTFVVSTLLNVLNTNEFYHSLSEVFDKWCSFLWKLPQEFLQILLPRLLRNIFNKSWCPVALFYVTYAIALLDKCECLYESFASEFHEFLVNAMQTHDIVIRKAIQHNLVTIWVKFITKFPLKVSYLLLTSLAENLGNFTNLVSTWLKNNVTAAEINVYLASVNTATDCTGLARLLLLLKPNFGKQVIEYVSTTINDNLSNISERPYASHENVIFSLKLLTSLLQLDDIVLSPDAVAPIMPCIILTLPNETDAELIYTIMTFLHVALKADNIAIDITQIIPSISLYVRNITNSDHSPAQSYILADLLYWLAKVNQKYPGVESLKHFFPEVFTELVEKEFFCRALTSEFASRFTISLWSALELHLHTTVQCDFLIQTSESITKQALHALDISSQDTVIPIMCCLRYVLPHMNDIEGVTNVCWNLLMELRKSNLFWKGMDKFILMLFQPQLMNVESNYGLYQKYANILLDKSQVIHGLYQLFWNHLSQLWMKGKLSIEKLNTFSYILIAALTFGPGHRKDQKIVFATWEFILSKELITDHPLQSDRHADIHVRSSAVKVLLLLTPTHADICWSLTEALLTRSRQQTPQSGRYYGDSTTHRIKHRIFQAILILQRLLTEHDSHQLLQRVLEEIISESSQPSIRYFQEWLVLLILNRNKNLFPTFFSAYQKAINTRVGSICSFISIALHFATMEDESVVMKCLKLILPWSMGQNFNVRLYAQVAFHKLWQVSEEKGYKKVLESYSPIHEGLGELLNSSNASKNSKKLLDNFYFKHFHPLQYYTLETIFYELPRLAKVTNDEWIKSECFDISDTSNDLGIPCRNSNDALQNCEAAAWVIKASCETNEFFEVGNFQKKITPWKEMIENGTSQKEPVCELIVVASLIDRIPNLGGLCRTCEIFKVKEYVLGSLKYTEDKQFQSLSVTAEQWVHLTEVKPHMLPLYMAKKKEEGYILVGVEQTANSVSLDTFIFPKKSLILLGKERDGIPAELLHHLDVCVAVPQQGLLRSLNVHVTAALFVWEYTRQHVIIDREY